MNTKKIGLIAAGLFLVSGMGLHGKTKTIFIGTYFNPTKLQTAQEKLQYIINGGWSVPSLSDTKSTTKKGLTTTTFDIEKTMNDQVKYNLPGFSITTEDTQEFVEPDSTHRIFRMCIDKTLVGSPNKYYDPKDTTDREDKGSQWCYELKYSTKEIPDTTAPSSRGTKK